MPIKFVCQHCQHAIEASSKHAGHRVECPTCKQPVVVPQAQQQPQAAASPAEPEEIQLEDIEQPAPRRRQRSGQGGIMSVIGPPRGMALSLLWLGLLLVMLSFTLKHLFVDVAITSVPGAFEYPRLIAKKQAEKFPLYDDVREIEKELYDGDRDRFREEADFDRDSFRERNDERDRLRERLREAEKKADEAAEEIDEKYEDKLRRAELSAIKSGASGLGWLQRGIWVKILVDLPKILGCFLIVFSAMPIVSDPEQQTPVKAYAIACSSVVLIYATLYAALAFFS